MGSTTSTQFFLFQAAPLQTEGAAVSFAFRLPPLGGTVTVCQATSATKKASAALLLVSHPTAKHSAEVDKLTQITLHPSNLQALIFYFNKTCNNMQMTHFLLQSIMLNYRF